MNLKAKLVSSQQNQTAVELSCQRCSHKWNYSGKNQYVTSCPSCKTSVMVHKNRDDLTKK